MAHPRAVPADVWKRIARGRKRACWPWTGKQNRGGYGVWQDQLVHRVVYGLVTQDPGSLCVLHSCDNPACCNPAHLFLGTRGDNARDCMEKKRHRRGEAHPFARLTVRSVRRLRTLRARGYTWFRLGCMFDVAMSTVRSAVQRRNWKDVE